MHCTLLQIMYLLNPYVATLCFFRLIFYFVLSQHCAYDLVGFGHKTTWLGKDHVLA